MSKKLEDCYYFFYGTCVKNEECEYRHSAEALGVEKVCKQWMKGQCRAINCPFRHMKPNKIRRSHIQCFYEHKASGCRKPHCMYRHTTDRKYILDDIKVSPNSLILPLELEDQKVTTTSTIAGDIMSQIKHLVALNMNNNDDPPCDGVNSSPTTNNTKPKVVDVLKASDKRKASSVAASKPRVPGPQPLIQQTPSRDSSRPANVSHPQNTYFGRNNIRPQYTYVGASFSQNSSPFRYYRVPVHKK